MKTNAEKIADWRLANPHPQITEDILLKILGLETLRRADLRWADLYDADLTGANLYGADLQGANLCWVELSGADLSGVNLRGATLKGVDLPGYMPLKTPSGDGDIRATPYGWRVTIGCWDNRTLEDLKALIADKVDWPEAKGDEREKRRPFLVAVAALMEAQAAYYPNLITELAEKWN